MFGISKSCIVFILWLGYANVKRHWSIIWTSHWKVSNVWMKYSLYGIEKKKTKMRGYVDMKSFVDKTFIPSHFFLLKRHFCDSLLHQSYTGLIGYLIGGYHKILLHVNWVFPLLFLVYFKKGTNISQCVFIWGSGLHWLTVRSRQGYLNYFYFVFLTWLFTGHATGCVWNKRSPWRWSANRNSKF